MDVFRESNKFDPKQLRQLNYCRLYLNVTVTSDICDASGRNIDPGMASGDLTQTGSTHRERAVIQSRPDTTAAWRLWRKALKLITQDTNARKLRKPLVSGSIITPN
jgi:hypothetical protein